MTAYRILECAGPEGDWSAGGLAYEREGCLHLWLPAWRGPRALRAARLADLGAEDFPSSEPRWRWAEQVEEWEGETFSPLAALQDHVG